MTAAASLSTIRAPFPWFGGKRRVAADVWAAFGDVANYVEPFAGSLAVLLGRPTLPRIETVNDADAYLANFWRAVKAAPNEVEHWCSWPVNEADLHARHLWLIGRSEFRERMLADPDFYDVKIAGWWVWGLCSWIGSGWCDLGNAGRGVHRPSQQLPHLGNAMGVHRPSQQLPHLGDAGMGASVPLFDELSERLRRVRVACGDWSRVLGDSVTWRHGVTGVFLDPPYDDGEVSYAAGGTGISAAVREWAIEAGAHPKMRVALCGYDGEHDMPDTWSVHAWKAHGGYGSQRSDGVNENAKRERIWFSPHCLSASAAQISLFPGAA